MKKLFLLVCVLSVIAFAGQVSAQTAVNSPINNTAIVSANNMAAPASDFTNTIVRRIQGADYTVIPVDGNGSAGNVSLLSFTIRNRGNSNDTFSLKITNTQTNATFGSHGSWTNVIVDNGGVNVINTTGNLAAGGTFVFQIRVRPVGTAPDGDWKEFQVLARSTVLTTTYATNYIGDNGTAYGGDMGQNWLGVNTYPAFNGALTHGIGSTSGGASTNTWVRVTIQGPVLVVTKRITAIHDPWNGTLVIPGSTITYSVKVTNQGTAAALNPRIFDAIPANTTYVGGSATFGTVFTAPGFSTNGSPVSWVRWSAANFNQNAVDTVTFRVRVN